MGLDIKRPSGCRKIKLYFFHTHVCVHMNECVLGAIVPELGFTSEHRASLGRGFGSTRP